jgi:hypothetical protein
MFHAQLARIGVKSAECLLHADQKSNDPNNVTGGAETATEMSHPKMQMSPAPHASSGKCRAISLAKVAAHTLDNPKNTKNVVTVHCRGPFAIETSQRLTQTSLAPFAKSARSHVGSLIPKMTKNLSGKTDSKNAPSAFKGSSSATETTPQRTPMFHVPNVTKKMPSAS